MNGGVHRSLERLLLDEPDNHDLRLHLASLLLDDGQAAAALGHCETVLRSEPTSEPARELAARARSELRVPATDVDGGEQRTASVSVADVGTDRGEIAASDLYELVRPEVTLDDVAAAFAGRRPHG
ncbi:tetratricopeptide repeat protein [Desertimonas flava]|uniref:tetratricopeptide repeat protein n=1 Tax=Desertimonas flava TaxID=2064846 RepID=UPI0013C4FC94|nr:tetratricopeptide repeat protein [Desertimonas flava]